MSRGAEARAIDSFIRLFGGSWSHLMTGQRAAALMDDEFDD